MIDITGKKYGDLTALYYIKRGRSGGVWICRCDCGNEKGIRSHALRTGATKSCGCKSSQYRGEKMIRHGHSKKRNRTREYSSWSAIISRCTNENDKFYSKYGGAGIFVCDRWLLFDNFLEDMGIRPQGTSIDRINNDDGYYKENCRWATRKEQQRNRSANRWFMFRGEMVIFVELCERFKINQSTVIARLKRGWGVEDSFSIVPSLGNRINV